MKIGNLWLIRMSLCVLWLSACSAQMTEVPTSTPTATEVPLLVTPSLTPTLTPTFTPTTTLTSTPTETSIPLPASLVGTVTLAGQSPKPVVGAVELREAETFNLLIGSNTNAKGEYKLENIDPGKYELWVLFTTQATMLAGCDDVILPQGGWKLGIEFDGNKALTMEVQEFSKALLLAEGLQGAGMQPVGFYAVLTDFEVLSGVENQLDVTLACK